MPASSRSQRLTQWARFWTARGIHRQHVHVDRQLVADLPARIDQPRAVVEREVHRLRVQHLAARPEIGHVAGRHHAGHVLSDTASPSSSTAPSRP